MFRNTKHTKSFIISALVLLPCMTCLIGETLALFTSDPEKGTDKVCRDNGEQVMYQSYAKLLPADGINATHAGTWHVRMVSEAAHVEYAPDGTIDGEKSYVRCIEQASRKDFYTAPDGTKLNVMAGVDLKYTFASLFKSCYIPFTFAEFLGSDPVEPSEVTLDLDQSTVTAEMHGGFVLYNGGFTAGLSALILIPLLDFYKVKPKHDDDV